jgi:xylan 1,4-beta-xylosidase
VEFVDGWPRLAHGGHHAALTVEVDTIPAGLPPTDGFRDDFDAPELDSRRWSTLRAPLGTAGDLHSRPGWLRLRAGQSPASVFDQSMIATRAEELRGSVETVVDAQPTSTREMAGLIAWYDRQGWIWLQLTWDRENGRHLRVVQRDGAITTRSEAVPVAAGPVRLRAELDGPELRFSSAALDEPWQAVAGIYPAWTLSDDHGPRLRFTGLFFGVRADDLDGQGWAADFDYVDVRFDRPE